MKKIPKFGQIQISSRADLDKISQHISDPAKRTHLMKKSDVLWNLRPNAELNLNVYKGKISKRVTVTNAGGYSGSMKLSTVSNGTFIQTGLSMD